MTFALCLQVPNHFKFKRYSDLYTNFIPQIIFLQSIFGYLVICILYKWSIDWSKATTQPPSLLNMLISMFLQPGTVDPDLQLYRGQATIQVVLLLLAAVCVPWLLISKPYLVWKETQRPAGYISIGHGEAAGDMHTFASGVSPEDEEEGNGQSMLQAAEEEAGVSYLCLSAYFPLFHIGFLQEHHDFGEVVIHQIIHTIEFCLGCISHTASYLRLWALSLAHAQLSEVLWSMTLERYLNPTSILGWIALLIMGGFWLTCTIGILCVMEVRFRFICHLGYSGC